jgi:hypothetical protein
VPAFFLHAGVKLNSVALEFARLGLAAATVGAIAQGETRFGTTQGGTPTSLTFNRISQFQGSIKRAGSPVRNLTGGSGAIVLMLWMAGHQAASWKWGSPSMRPAVTQIDQQLAPRLLALAVAVAEPDQLLAAPLVGTDHDQDALALLVEPGVEIHAVDPEVDVALASRVAAFRPPGRVPCLGARRTDGSEADHGMMAELLPYLTVLAGQKEIADCDHDRRRASAALPDLSPTSPNGETRAEPQEAPAGATPTGHGPGPAPHKMKI